LNLGSEKLELESAVEIIELVYAEAEKLAKKWFPDVEEYPQQKRIAILSLMKMIIDLIMKGTRLEH